MTAPVMASTPNDDAFMAAALAQRVTGEKVDVEDVD